MHFTTSLPRILAFADREVINIKDWLIEFLHEMPIPLICGIIGGIIGTIIARTLLGL